MAAITRTSGPVVMGYKTPSSRSDAVGEVLEAVNAAHRVVLTTHVNADGDGAGCQVAMASWLRSRGKDAWIVNPTPFPELYAFLLKDPSWVVKPAGDEAKEVCGAADLGMVLDTGEVHRIGRVKPLFDPLPKVVVDHHPMGDAPIAGVSFRDPDACAAGELLYDLFLEGGADWSDDLVDGLYVAILTDTGGFQFSNSTPDCHRIAAELIERGADPETLHRRIYGSIPLKTMLLLRASLNELEVELDGKIAWMTVPKSAVDELNATPEDMEGLANYPRMVQGSEVGIVFRETSDGATKISFRSNGDLDVNALARMFGGGGHLKASGALVPRPLVEVREEVLAATREAARRLKGAEGEEA